VLEGQQLRRPEEAQRAREQKGYHADHLGTTARGELGGERRRERN
jgi:hypothetical protein